MTISMPPHIRPFLRWRTSTLPCANGLARAWPALIIAALLACEPASPSVPPAQATPSRRDEATWRELDRIDRLEWSYAGASDAALRTIQERAVPGSPEQLEAICLRLGIAAHVRNTDLVEQLIKDLEPWPAEPLRRAAKLTAAYGRASLLRERGDLHGARKALPDLQEYADDAIPVNLLLRSYILQGSIQAETNAADRAVASGEQALKLGDRSGEHWRRATALYQLAWFYFRAQQLDRAKVANADALTEAEADPVPSLLFHIYTVRSILYEDDPDSGIVLRADAMALRYARQSGDVAALALAVANSADSFLRQRNFPRALELANEGLDLARKSNNPDGEIVSLANIGLARIGLGQVDEGKRICRTAIEMYESRGSLRYAAEAWQELGNALEVAGDYAGAIEALHNYRHQFDQLLQDDTRKAILEEQERFDDERRAREIDLLNRDNSLKSEQLRARDLEIKLWLELAGCIVVSGALLGIAYRRVHRTNLALATTNASLKVQSERDPLTGLANRRHLQAAIKRLAQGGKISGTVFLIDIDHFKRINDQYGHVAGDTVLVEVARRLRAASREEDLIVRWGGEEFVIVAGARGGHFAKDLAQRLLDEISEPDIAHGNLRITVTASIGFAGFPLQPHGLDVHWERAIDLVDTLMYMAKAHGRNKAYGMQKVDAHSEQELQDLSSRMERAWQEGRVVLSTSHGPAKSSAQAS